jgi:hypothetical protein
VVERILGKAEVVSSILTGSTIFHARDCRWQCGQQNQIGRKTPLSVAVAKRLFAQRALDPAGDRIADPDDGAEQKHGKRKHERGDHESNLRDFRLAPMD